MKHTNPNGTWLVLDEQVIQLGDQQGEIASFPRHWWANDDAMVLELANAVRVLCTEGSRACRKLLGK